MRRRCRRRIQDQPSGSLAARRTFQKQEGANRCGRLFINIETVGRDGMRSIPRQARSERPEARRPQQTSPAARKLRRRFTVHWTASLRVHQTRERPHGRTEQAAGDGRVCAALVVTSHSFDSSCMRAAVRWPPAAARRHCARSIRCARRHHRQRAARGWSATHATPCPLRSLHACSVYRRSRRPLL